MCDRKQEAPAAREAACMLCHRTEADPDMCGEKREKHGLCAHVFCLFFATLLYRQKNDRVGLMGFLPRDIQLAVRRAAEKHCCVCSQSGATIVCCEENCDRWFHLPCAKEGGCINQYITPYSSYCSEHRPEQDVQVTPEPGTECPICMEPVEDRKTFQTMVCPACKRAWFHRDCIQGQAMSAGLLCLHCPLCRDSEAFTLEMFIMGIRIPFRQPTWEDNDAFADLGERHSWCNARECLYPGGREGAEEEGPWELLLCSSCAAEGTHRRCSGLRNRTHYWECDTCAGRGTASRVEPDLNDHSLVQQSGLESSHSSSESETSSTSSCSPGLSALAPQNTHLETRSHSRPQHTAAQQSLPSPSLDPSSRSAQREATLRSSFSSSPDAADRVHSRRAGRRRRRNRSRRQGHAPNRRIRARYPCDRRSRTRQRTRRSRRRATQSRAYRGRSRFCRQGRALSAPVHSRRDRRSRTGPRAERPRQRETSSRACPRRSRSHQQRRASNQASWSRSVPERSRRTAASAERARHKETPSGTSPRRSRSHQQRRASKHPAPSRSRQNRSRSPAANAERPRHRGTPSRTSRRSNRSRQRRRASSRISSSST